MPVADEPEPGQQDIVPHRGAGWPTACRRATAQLRFAPGTGIRSCRGPFRTSSLHSSDGPGHRLVTGRSPPTLPCTSFVQPPPLRVKLTYQDYLRIPDDRLRHEILDGVHVVTPSPESYHQELVARLVTELGLRVGRPRLGRVLGAPMDVLLSDNDVVH